MRMKIPITGTVIEEEPFIIGDENDPIRPVNLDLGNVSWRMIKLDIENEEMEIEVSPPEFVHSDIDTGKKDEWGEPIYLMRSPTPEEKAQFLEYAKQFSLESKTKDELYEISGSPRLKRISREELI